jgi:riboflavin biosynthesis pyrimidine reductase
LVDRVVFYIAPTLIGGPLPVVGGRGAGTNEEGIRLAKPTYRLVGGDLRVEGVAVYPRKRRR